MQPVHSELTRRAALPVARLALCAVLCEAVVDSCSAVPRDSLLTRARLPIGFRALVIGVLVPQNHGEQRALSSIPSTPIPSPPFAPDTPPHRPAPAMSLSDAVGSLSADAANAQGHMSVQAPGQRSTATEEAKDDPSENRALRSPRRASAWSLAANPAEQIPLPPR